MMQLNRRNLLLWAAILTVVFLLTTYFVPEPPLITILNGVFFGISVAVATVYSPIIWYSMRYSKFDRVGQLSIGIGLIWLSMFLQRVWSSFNRFFGDLYKSANSPAVTFILFIAIVGGCLFVTAPGYYSLEPEMQPDFGGTNRKLLLIFGSIGGLITAILYIMLTPRF